MNVCRSTSEIVGSIDIEIPPDQLYCGSWISFGLRQPLSSRIALTPPLNVEIVNMLIDAIDHNYVLVSDLAMEKLRRISGWRDNR